MRTLLLDNYDSYTYNLFQLLAVVAGREPIVAHNDELSLSAIEALAPGAIVISPGPGTPEHPHDLGVGAELIRRSRRPILGVCLGHQAIAWVWGGRIAPAPEIVHGGLSRIRHDNSPLFAAIPQGFEAVRYHSLVAEDLPASLEACAWTDDDIVMALRHRELPQWGVQFHPESICSEHGATLIENFLRLARAYSGEVTAPRSRNRPRTRSRSKSVTGDRRRERLELFSRCLDWCRDPEDAFVGLFAASTAAFWLDSSRAPSEIGRFSFMGDASGPFARVFSYDLEGQRLHETGTRRRARTYKESVFDYLERELERLRVETCDLPFDFAGGFVGYLGYELKAETGGEIAHDSPYPDAAFVLADRFIVFDHAERQIWLVELREKGASGDGWLDATETALRALPPASGALTALNPPALFQADLAPDDYLAAIASCRHELECGESYEICLTTQLRAEGELDPLVSYLALRRLNPAPFAAYLRFGDLAVLSSSPERLLRLDREHLLETRPIKGTAARSSDPAEDERRAIALRASAKTKAENLMIADLMRNDLGRVCEIGSVEVPALMAVESYMNVHQLVTTVTGRLREDASAVDALRAVFPAGSMTGAPKIRTMQIIDELEPCARGVYSGCLGYLSLTGTLDMSVVIRTLTSRAGQHAIGTGGAITVLSDPLEELAELELKAEPLLRALATELRV